MMEGVSAPQATPADKPQTITAPPVQEPATLDDAATQEQYRQEYLTQLRRMSCPGCGEDNSVF